MTNHPRSPRKFRVGQVVKTVRPVIGYKRVVKLCGEDGAWVGHTMRDSIYKSFRNLRPLTKKEAGR